MANTAGNVFVGATGSVYVAAADTALPTTLTAATTSFTDLGYVGEDGIKESEPRDTDKKKAWQNGDIVRILQTSHELTYSFTLIEKSSAVQDLVYGGHGTTGTPLEITGDALAHHAFVIDVFDGSNKRRICIPDAQIAEKGDVTYSNSDVTAYEVTITCYADGSGNKAYVYEGTVA